MEETDAEKHVGETYNVACNIYIFAPEKREACRRIEQFCEK